LLGEPVQRSGVASTPSFQQFGDSFGPGVSLEWRLNLYPLSGGHKKSNTNVTGFARRFRLFQRKENIMHLNLTAKSWTLKAFAVLALGMAPAAMADSKGCSNATIKGTFAETDSGFITAPPTMAGPFAGVLTVTYDGNGNMTTSGMGSINGNIIASSSKGTYTVNSDCTGTYTVTIQPLGITAHAYFVIADSGNEIRIVVTDPGLAVTCIARRQFPAGDWRQ
jgi:hypothetical protein